MLLLQTIHHYAAARKKNNTVLVHSTFLSQPNVLSMRLMVSPSGVRTSNIQGMKKSGIGFGMLIWIPPEKICSCNVSVAGKKSQNILHL